MLWLVTCLLDVKSETKVNVGAIRRGERFYAPDYVATDTDFGEHSG